jgi:hypothetical protein
MKKKSLNRFFASYQTIPQVRVVRITDISFTTKSKLIRVLCAADDIRKFSLHDFHFRQR